MTYCVAMCLADGLVFASDSAPTRASTILPLLKSCTFSIRRGERVLVLQSAGNLATTQSVISLLSARIRTQQEPNLMQVTSLYDAAMLIGKTLLEVIQRDSSSTSRPAVTPTSTATCCLAARSPAKPIVCSIFIRRATLLKPPATRLISRLAKANTANRSSIGC